MDIHKLIVVPVDSDVARLYQWDNNCLTMEELVAFIASRGKIPSTDWIEK